jgi:O-antigen chain-terminating methyltransferase
MNPKEVVNQIRARVIREEARRSATAPDSALDPLRERIKRLRISCEKLYELRNSVGRMPPSPETRRAQIGARAVRMVQRLLFWYSPQVNRVHDANTVVADNVCLALEEQEAALERLSAELSRICAETRLRAGVERVRPPDSSLVASSSGFDAFALAMECDLRTSGHRHHHCQQYMDMIETQVPPVPPGVWLDVASGNGDWLAAVKAAGHACAGIDGNASAVAHAQALGLPVEHADALTYLRGCPDSQFAVIALVRVAGRLPMPSLFALVREAVRTLKPGGTILLESPDPASALAACQDCWAEASFVRPLPVATAEYLLQYFGLRISARHFLDAYSNEEVLPFSELEFVRRLNEALYGPRAYALLAQREPQPGLPPEARL